MHKGYMCDRNIVARIYNHGGTRVISTNTEKMGRTAREMAEVQRDSYEAPAENLAAAQRRNIGLANDGPEFMRLQEENARAAQEWFGAYRDFFFSPFAYAQEGLRTSQRATRQGLEATQQVTNQGLRVSEEAAERTDEVLRQTEEATREAELRAAVLGALGTADYEGLSVAEISRRLDGLTAERLREVREFEKRNKDRETLIEQIDRRIRANS